MESELEELRIFGTKVLIEFIRLEDKAWEVKIILKNHIANKI